MLAGLGKLHEMVPRVCWLTRVDTDTFPGALGMMQGAGLEPLGHADARLFFCRRPHWEKAAGGEVEPVGERGMLALPGRVPRIGNADGGGNSRRCDPPTARHPLLSRLVASCPFPPVLPRLLLVVHVNGACR